MPAVLTELPSISDPPRKRWTRVEFEAVLEAGLLDRQLLELIDGEVISKMGQNPPHVNSAMLMLHWLQVVFGSRFVYHEAPIEVATGDRKLNAPQPDLTVLKRDFRDFHASKPEPEDIHMVVEVADTTLGFDLRTKAPLYARAGITEYWVLDIAKRQMVVHREPEAGHYQSVVEYDESERVAPLAAPEAELLVSEVLPVSRV